ncbi:MAG: PTS glucose transporter subunit IIA [Micromonosporaceae bacterium]|nr:PTS glucose transporter subunit IIA [Micromonosporaceae bacterium]
MGLAVVAPVAGTVIPLSEVPDPVFAGGLVGPGAAIAPDPAGHRVVAPVGGELVKVKPHAFVVASPQGYAVLVHLGIDTVRLDGAGFTVLAAPGQLVAAGDPVVRWDPAAVATRGLATTCPVVALDAPAGAVTQVATGRVAAGDPLFTWI